MAPRREHENDTQSNGGGATATGRKMTQGFELYGAEVSYFTGKIRAYLRYKKIPFVETVASREIYKTVIMPRVGWPVIPVMVTPEGETLQDTTDMIDALETRYPDPSVYPATPRQRFAALLLEVYGDEWLKIPAMHYRWTKNRDFAVTEFGRLSRPDLPEDAQREIGEETAKPFAGALPALGCTEVSGPAIEKSYEGLLGELEAHFSRHDYLFGSRPSIGDFGLIGPLYAHQYRDPASGELMKRVAPHVAKWVERMMKPPHPKEGEFLSGDEIPDTLIPVLQRVMREYLPVLLSTAENFKTFLAGHQEVATGEQELPRAIGFHEYTLEGVTASRAIFPFDLWMLQRPLDHLRGLEGAEREAVEKLLNMTGGEAMMTFPDYPRLTRRNFKLALA